MDSIFNDDEILFNLRITSSNFPINKNKNCSCGKPIFPLFAPSDNYVKCVYCLDNGDISNKCYSCDQCKNNREYIKETDNIFYLEGYGFHEIWKCNKCNSCIAFPITYPSIQRDSLHAKYRKIHLNYHCDNIKNKIIEF